jgi:NarL family two-component system response regulator LiaR
MKSITIIDDNNVDCLLLKSWFNQNNNFKVIHQYHSGIDAIKDSELLQSEYCIIDVGMPLLNGIDTSILLLQKGYKGKILLVSHAYSHEYMIKAKKACVHGYCMKDRDVILNCIVRMETEAFCFDEIAYKDWKKFTEKHNLQKKDADYKVVLLNPHHRKILLYSCKGFSTGEISEFMGLKKHTVEQYRAAMLQLLGFSTLAQAIAWAIASHIINHSEVFTLPHQNKCQVGCFSNNKF